MKFLIITHVDHISLDNHFFAYAPYVHEMNIWLKHVGEVVIVAPLSQGKSISAIHLSYTHHKLHFVSVPSFHFTRFLSLLKSLFVLPGIMLTIYRAMFQSSHIHLRCPGNMGLLGAIVQIAFPKIPKTAKYAGNWDPKAKQPWSYRLQKWILSNTFLTRNMQVLVYGEWEASKNIKPFFTATYCELDKIELDFLQANRLAMLHQSEIRLLFIGTLSKGKQPFYAIQLVEQLQQNNYAVRLDLYGDGDERNHIERYILEKNLQNSIISHGNQTKQTIQLAYQSGHFLILPSKSEGWPKVVAEAMFWGCVPIATAVSCVPNMLAHGDRGLLLSMDVVKDSARIQNIVNDSSIYFSKSANAAKWSRLYTLDYFESEIKKLLQEVSHH